MLSYILAYYLHIKADTTPQHAAKPILAPSVIGAKAAPTPPATAIPIPQ